MFDELNTKDVVQIAQPNLILFAIPVTINLASRLDCFIICYCIYSLQNLIYIIWFMKHRCI